MGFDPGILSELDVDIQTGLDYTGGKDKYVSALQRYYKSSVANRALMQEYLDKGDMDNFRITVHALKSNSKMIGAEALGKMFETLEALSGENDIEAVKEHFPGTLEKYDELLAALKPLGEMKAFHAAGELSASEAIEIADSLLEALDDYDDDLSAELIDKLAGYPFRITQRGKLKEAAVYVSEFMYDEAADLVREIYSSIE